MKLKFSLGVKAAKKSKVIWRLIWATICGHLIIEEMTKRLQIEMYVYP